MNAFLNTIQKAVCCALSTLACCMAIGISNLCAADCEQSLADLSSGGVPDHLITYENESAPEWKAIWDKARILYKQKKYGQAQVQYELLLARKGNVDQARWEYTSILICRRQWQQAEAELALLIGHDPSRPEYQLAKAEVALDRGHYPVAVKAFERLYLQLCPENSCQGDTIRILTGYSTALEKNEQYDDLLPLMEQLIVLHPEDEELRNRAMDIAGKSNQPAQALILLERLAEINPEDSRLLAGLARVHARAGNQDTSSAYWQQVIGLNNQNREAHEQLIGHYHRAGNRSMELKHVEALLAITLADHDLLGRAARLHIALGRPDRALEYCDLQLSIQPGNSGIAELRQQALRELAAKLLDLIVNSGPGMLWQDLVEVTTDRTGVYQAIADMLREQGRVDKLIEVLLVIHHEDPENDHVREELSVLLQGQGRRDILVYRDMEPVNPAQ